MRILLLLLLTGLPAWAGHAWADCGTDGVELQVLGSGGPELDDGRASSAYLVRVDGKARVLVDIGGGASLNFERAGARLEDLDAVLFTHFHVDHSADFPVLIKAAYFSGRERDLPVFGPQGNDWMPSARAFVEKTLGTTGAWRYLSDFVHSDEPAAFHLRVHDVALDRFRPQFFSIDKTLRVAAIAVHHGPLPALAWRVEAKGCVVVFSGDMNNDYHSLARLAKKADLLVAHNAIPQGATGVARRLHMPPSEIGRIAQRAGVHQLVLSHRMRRTLGREAQTRAEIRKNYAGPLYFAEDLDRFPVMPKDD